MRRAVSHKSARKGQEGCLRVLVVSQVCPSSKKAMSSSASEVYEKMFPEEDDEGRGKMYALLFSEKSLALWASMVRHPLWLVTQRSLG